MMLSRNFSRAEFASKCGRPGHDTVDAELIAVLQQIRDHFDRPVTILSGNRSPEHNRAVGGAANSQHLKGRAADITVADATPKEVADFVTETFGMVSVGRYKTFTHIDTRTGGPVYWGSN